MMKRGRPAGTLTHRRKQVLAYLCERAAEGERITLGRIVRACGFYGREDAKRVLRGLRAMGHDPDLLHTPNARRGGLI